jgi:hypothetical protein
MTLKFVGDINIPTYTALSSDIALDGTLTGASRIGGTVFMTDTAEWYIVSEDRTLQPYALPVQITIDPGSIDIGDVGINQPVASAVHIAPFYGTQSVAVPGTAEPLVGVATYAISLTVFPKLANTDDVYIGTSAVDKDSSQQIVLSPGSSSAVIDVPIGYKIDIHNWYVDSKVAAEGVNFFYLK